MTAPMDSQSITQRLALVSTLADLRPHYRLHKKIDMSPTGITRRLEQVEQLRRLCLTLGSLEKDT